MRQWKCLDQTRLYTGFLLIALTIFLGCFFHYFHIAQLPMGFYIDESSIGYNAHLISQTGADEHGERWPVFFKAFGEYKNPLYIYLLAGLYQLLGYSTWTTRALSATCWLTGTVTAYALGRRLFTNPVVHIYLILSLSFTPWIFSVSRISFELITLFPLLALHLLALYRGFEESSSKWALLSGLSLSLCLYAYTTFRLLAFISAVAVLVCYSAPQFRRVQIRFIVGFLAGAILFVLYAFLHHDSLTTRFNYLTYVYDPTRTYFAKLALFAARYVGYFDPKFLALSGDDNLRHHTGFGGELLVTTTALLLVALVTSGRHRPRRFYAYLIAGVLISPIAASLTFDTHHSLRSFSMAVYAIPLSAFGINALGAKAGRVSVVLTAVCASLYIAHYFFVYPAISAMAFENFDFQGSLREALSRSPIRVVLLTHDEEFQYINLKFFGSLIGNSVPLVMGSRENLRLGDVAISHDPAGSATHFYSVDDKVTRTVAADAKAH